MILAHIFEALPPPSPPFELCSSFSRLALEHFFRRAPPPWRTWRQSSKLICFPPLPFLLVFLSCLTKYSWYSLFLFSNPYICCWRSSIVWLSMHTLWSSLIVNTHRASSDAFLFRNNDSEANPLFSRSNDVNLYSNVALSFKRISLSDSSTSSKFCCSSNFLTVSLHWFFFMLSSFRMNSWSMFLKTKSAMIISGSICLAFTECGWYDSELSASESMASPVFPPSNWLLTSKLKGGIGEHRKEWRFFASSRQ